MVLYNVEQLRNEQWVIIGFGMPWGEAHALYNEVLEARITDNFENPVLVKSSTLKGGLGSLSSLGFSTESSYGDAKSANIYMTLNGRFVLPPAENHGEV